MKVKINSNTIEVADESSLADALDAAGYDGKGVATAVNGEVVPAGSRCDFRLKEGDNILLIKAFYGG